MPSVRQVFSGRAASCLQEDIWLCAVLEMFVEDLRMESLCFLLVIDIICMQMLILTREEKSR